MNHSHWKSPESKARATAAGTINLRRFSRLGADRRWRGRIPIPANAHPLVREFFRLLNQDQTLLSEVASRAGVQYATISDWRYRRSPTLPLYVAALNALGYELKITPIRTNG